MSRPDAEQQEWPEVVVRDNRKIDSDSEATRSPGAEGTVPGDGESGAPSEPGDSASPSESAGASAETDEASRLRGELDERTADLQRLSAEYANYRRRVDRDRQAVTDNAQAQVVGELLPVLDNITRADEHGDLTGAFKTVADGLIETLSAQGLEAFGAEGDAFDPDVHEAVQHDTSPEVTGPTVTALLRRGYRFGDRVLRPAMVAVTDAENSGGASGGGAGGGSDTEQPEASEPAQS